MKKALFIICFLASMVYGLERGATSNFKYIIDTGVQSIYVLQDRTQVAMTYHFSLFLTFLIHKPKMSINMDVTTTAIWVR